MVAAISLALPAFQQRKKNGLSHQTPPQPLDMPLGRVSGLRDHFFFFVFVTSFLGEYSMLGYRTT